MSGLSPSQAEEARIVIQEQVNRAASSSGASPSSPTHDVPALIRNLAELKEAGIISEAEFEAKKKDLLDRM